MTPMEFEQLKAVCRPAKINCTEDGRIVVALGEQDVVLYAAEVDHKFRLVEWFPNHPFVIKHLESDAAFSYRPEPKPIYYDYILGPV